MRLRFSEQHGGVGELAAVGDETSGSPGADGQRVCPRCKW